jgi:hypothetical protein
MPAQKKKQVVEEFSRGIVTILIATNALEAGVCTIYSLPAEGRRGGEGRGEDWRDGREERRRGERIDK